MNSLKKHIDLLDKRKKTAERYNRAFSEYDFITTAPFSENHAWHLYSIKINENKLRISRDDFIDKLFEKGIGVSVHFIPLHIMPYYRDKYGLKPEDYPNALENFLKSISLPIYPDLNDLQTERIINAVIETGKEYYR